MTFHSFLIASTSITIVVIAAAAGVSSVGCQKEEQPPPSRSRQSLLAAPAPIDGPACAESTRRCTVSFAYVDRTAQAQSVEVRGDFRADGWTRGTPMIKRGNTWTADVDVPYGREVQYKLVLDGSRWTRDPARPTPAAGTDNSQLEAVTCNPHRCEVAP